MTPAILQFVVSPLIGVIGLAVTGYFGYLVHKVSKETKEIRDHVANTHSTNLRDDIDEIRDLVELGRAEQRADHKATKIELGFIREDIVELKESDTSLWGALKQKVSGSSD